MPRRLLRLALLASLAAAPMSAAGQTLDALRLQSELEDLRVQQELSRQRSVALHNELMTLEARVRTEQALRELERQNLRPILPQIPESGPGRPAPASGAAATSPSGFAEIPDDRLAASNARVRAASGGR